MRNFDELRQLFIQTDTPFKEGVADVFSQSFRLPAVKKASLIITALGIYEADLNGKRVGDLLLTPGYTYYPRELQVQVYDVTDALSEGENELRIFLGQGWYCGRYTYDNKCQIYGEHTAAAWILDVETEEGNLRITSRDDTVETMESPYEYAGIYDGEIYQGGTLKKGNDAVIPYTGKLPEVLEEGILYTKVQEKIPVQSAQKVKDVTILDFGQNFAGFVEIDPTYMDGQELKLRHGEILNSDGSLYTVNLRKAKQETVYRKGDTDEKYRPRFTFMGFRYVELSGVEYKPGLVTAYAIHSDMKRTGFFSCGNRKVNQLYSNQIWGQKSNYLEVPTDCPQRDERMGYTGDCHVFALTGAYNYDTEAFLSKFLKDIRYTQMDNSEGYVAGVVPALGPEGIGFINMLGWGNAVTILPWMMWKQFGTVNYLKEQYESMRLHVECEIRHFGKGLMGKKDLWVSPGLGDWLAPGKDAAFMAMHNGPVSNAFVVNDLRILSDTASMLGKPEDADRYRIQLEKTTASYIRHFIKKDGTMKDNYQGAYIMALALVLPKGELWDRCFAKLLEKLDQEGMQTGFFSTARLLPLLADNGRADKAFDLLFNEQCPGWLYQVNCGATTTWERWDALRPDGTVNEDKVNKKSDDNMVSFNHYAFGSVGEFYYRYILGIQPTEPGYRKIRLKPFFDARLGHVEGSYLSRAGEIKVAWQMEGEQAALQVTVPTDTDLLLPDGRKEFLTAGSYEYEISLR